MLKTCILDNKSFGSRMKYKFINYYINAKYFRFNNLYISSYLNNYILK
jgi:hypothetical protein